MSKDKFSYYTIKNGVVSGFAGVVILYLSLIFIAAFGENLLLQEKLLKITLKLLIFITATICTVIIKSKLQSSNILLQIIIGESILFLGILIPAVCMDIHIKLSSLALCIIVQAVGGYFGTFFKRNIRRKKAKRRR